jgi:hypothetical protein
MTEKDSDTPDENELHDALADFKRRERPPEPSSSEILSLADAIDLCGEKLFSSGWQRDHDWYARSPATREKWNTERRNWTKDKLMFALGAGNFTAIGFLDNPLEEERSYKRKAEVYDFLQEHLKNGGFQAFTLDDSPDGKNIIDPHDWAKEEATKWLDQGKRAEPVNEHWRAIWHGEEAKKMGHTKDYPIYLEKISLNQTLKKHGETVDKKFGVKANAATHKEYYQKHHNRQVKKFLAEEIRKPYENKDCEGKVLRSAMQSDGKSFNIDHFKEARNEVLAYAKGFCGNTNPSAKNLQRLKEYLQEKPDI